MKTSKILKLSIFVTLLFLVQACASTRTSKQTDTANKSPQAGAKANQKAPPAKPKFNINDYSVDYDGLQNYLKLASRRNTILGYESAGFNSCRASYGFPKNEPCYDLVYSVIHFRLQCRSTEGTTSDVQTNYNTRAHSNQNINWSVGSTRGSVTTDDEGFGQIKMITDFPTKGSRVKLSNGKDFLYMRAKDITRIVTPSSWCN